MNPNGKSQISNLIIPIWVGWLLLLVPSSTCAEPVVSKLSTPIVSGKIPPSLEEPLSAEEAARIGKQFFSMMNLSLPEMKEIQEAVDIKDYVQALKFYRHLFFLKFKNTTFKRAGDANFTHLKEPEFDDYLISLSGRPIRWYGKDAELHYLLQEPLHLIDAWKKSNDPKYLDGWFYIVADFAENNKKLYDALSPDELRIAPFTTDLHGAWGAFHVEWRVRSILAAFSEMTNSGNFNEEFVPMKAFTEILSCVVKQHVPILIAEPPRAPNQVIASALSLMKVSFLWPEFLDSNKWQSVAKQHFLDVFNNGSYLADGGDLEQSFNYNWSVPAAYKEAEDIFQGHPPEWVLSCRSKAIDRLRLLAAVQFPMGGLPAIGSGYHFAPPPLWNDEGKAKWPKMANSIRSNWKNDSVGLSDRLIDQIMEHLFGNDPKTTNVPGFTSVAFPYSGYYVLRSGWTNLDAYLWFKSSRIGVGHALENQNSLAITAYGRHLLIDSGPGNGFKNGVPEELKADFEDAGNYFGLSSFSHNTLGVDGYSQRQLLLPQRDTCYDQPIKARWHTSQYFDLVEGIYENGYGDRIKTIDVKHQRLVIFLRNITAWIVLDILEDVKTPQSHQFTQAWNFSGNYADQDASKAQCTFPGFSEDQVIFNQEAKTINTCDPLGPNVWLYQFGLMSLNYTSYYGHHKPFLGWARKGNGKKVDVHVDWNGSGKQMFLTFIVPSPNGKSRMVDIHDESKEGQTAFTGTTSDGTIIDLKASPVSEKLELGDSQIDARMILRVIRKGEPARGLILDADTQNPSNRQSGLPSDCEYECDNNKIKVIKPIICPKGFHWLQRENTLIPSYE
jgi:hypothetical protein